MAKKDKFQQMKQGGGALSSFQDMVEQAATVAAIEQKAAANNVPSDKADALSVTSGSAASNQQENGRTSLGDAQGNRRSVHTFPKDRRQQGM